MTDDITAPEQAESDDALRARVREWLDADPDPATTTELAALLDGLPATRAELADRFTGPLAFGTAGLRGVVRAGPNGMNRAVVRSATAGLVSYLDSQGDELAGPVVIGYDARHGSAEFATEAAKVVAATGREAFLLPRRTPTPVLAFAVRQLSAAAGIMVTASHNPPADNGYKVYLGGECEGGQLAPPSDRAIEAAIRETGPAREIPTADSYRVLDPDPVESYVDAVAAVVKPGGSRDISIAYTALHGVGGEIIAAAFERAGFRAPTPVADQQRPDPDFPTVAFPNPEEPGAMDLVRALAASRGADLAIANDPDADRCAVAIPDPAAGTSETPAGWRILHGDEVGALLADHLIRRGRTGTFATTIVSSSLLRSIARRAGRQYAETLTGFKWIVKGGEQTGTPLTFGYEEALGYCVAPEIVRDKDGISAALMVAELAAELKAAGRTIADRLDEIATENGLHSTDQLSVRVSDVDLIANAMRGLRENPPHSLLGAEISAIEDRADANALIWRADGVRVIIRPSGTEPKLKAYTEIVVPPEKIDQPGKGEFDPAAARISAGDQQRKLKAEIRALLNL